MRILVGNGLGRVFGCVVWSLAVWFVCLFIEDMDGKINIEISMKYSYVRKITENGTCLQEYFLKN